MSIDENKALVRRFVEQVWAKADVAAVEQLVHPDITVAYPLLPAPVHGREAFKQVLAQVQAAIPDLQATVDELIAEGDKVVVRWTLAGTQRGAFGPIPATGKRVRWTGIGICRIADGRVIEDRGEEDALGLMQQLGLVPTPEHAPTPA
jgi:steroid delta-isomerase-like uncharacterized protein